MITHVLLLVPINLRIQDWLCRFDLYLGDVYSRSWGDSSSGERGAHRIDPDPARARRRPKFHHV